MPAINQTVDEIESLSNTRHDYVHGAAIEYEMEQPQARQSNSISYRTDF
jgi:hypothetical protein